MPDAPCEYPQLLHHRPIDHGKSTLADQFLLKTGTISDGDINAQTSTAWIWNANAASPSACTPSPSTTTYKGKRYELNLIDTPGHVDFSYEVSRSSPPAKGRFYSSMPFRGCRPKRRQCLSGYGSQAHYRPGAQQD